MDLLRPTSSPGDPGGVLLVMANLTQLVVLEHRKLLQISKRTKEEPYFVDYIPPARDAITLSRNAAYILVGVVLVVVATYAIVGHLIKDLMHDMADCILGPKPMDEEDLEAERVDMGEEPCVSIYRRVEVVEEEEDRMKVEQEEREGQLPGHHPHEEARANPPLRSTMASHSGEKRTCAHNVVFSCPVLPYGTSL
ncbi:hypothetical protein NHX12_004753 [Muraenolepis orangiensis]|uniref:Uncharacterized protein n=1 Tax=Muraenolepis orangiensis TaxID=630683 RepID=A0A9Q0IEL4_9TELE|nr:hypothetical protein NHX12_004753 [Muraenolepis orangiensis]